MFGFIRVFWALASFDFLRLLSCLFLLMAHIILEVIFYRIILKVKTAELIFNHLLFRKHFDGKLQSESTNTAKTKRDADFEGTDEPIFGKKPRVEESITEDLR